MNVESSHLPRTLPPSSPVSRAVPLPAPVLVVEDDALMQRRIVGVLAALGYAPDVMVVAASLAQARTHLARLSPALALVDLGLPDGSGISLIKQLRADDPGVPILVISAWSTPEIILTALRSGATGYLLKERDDLELTLAVRSVLRGGAPIDPFIARGILELAQSPLAAAPGMPGHARGAAFDRAAQDSSGISKPSSSRGAAQTETDGGHVELSPREHEILQFVAQGLTNREIALHLSLSRHTVECHIKHVYQKLAVSTRTKAVFAARSRGWLA